MQSVGDKLIDCRRYYVVGYGRWSRTRQPMLEYSFERNTRQLPVKGNQNSDVKGGLVR